MLYFHDDHFLKQEVKKLKIQFKWAAPRVSWGFCLVLYRCTWWRGPAGRGSLPDRTPGSGGRPGSACAGCWGAAIAPWSGPAPGPGASRGSRWTTAGPAKGPNTTRVRLTGLQRAVMRRGRDLWFDSSVFYLSLSVALCCLRMVVHLVGEQGHEEREAAGVTGARLSAVERLEASHQQAVR